ncbi:MAG: creatininase [Candidatus Limnocylindrales bacterium]|jgi:creatinine amidohydrolase
MNGSSQELFEQMTWPDVASAVQAASVAVLPVGSLEQHGHHLPLGSDALVSFGLARRLAERRPLVILPPLFYAARSQPRASGVARAFPGSVGLHGAVLTEVCRDVVADLIRSGFRRIVVLNGHYENAGFLFEGIASATESRPEATVLLVNWWEQLHDEDLPRIFPEGFPGWEIEHAGIAETSLVEELYPELVREDRKTDDSGTRVLTYDVFPLPPDAVPPTGVPARSTPASREIGRYIADALVERIDAILTREFGAEDPAAGAPGQVRDRV